MRPDTNKRRLPATLGACLSAVALAACSAASAGSGSGAVTLAAVQPVTGLGAQLGQEQLNALRLGLQEAKGAGGPKIALISEDTGDSDTTAIAALSRALQSSPAAVWGTYLGTQILAERPTVERASTPMFDSSSTQAITAHDNKFIFRWYTNQEVPIKAAVQYATAELHVKRAAILSDSTDYGVNGATLLDQNLRAEGASVVEHEVVNPTDKDVSGQIAKIAAAKPDVLFVQIIGGAIQAVALKNIRAAGLNVPIVWSDAIVTKSILDLVTSAQVDGVYGVVGGATVVSKTSPDPAVRRFVSAYERRYGEDPGVLGAAAYDWSHAIVQAVKSGATSSGAIASYFRSHTYQGILGTYQSDGQLNMLHQALIVRMHGKDPKIVEKLRF